MSWRSPLDGIDGDAIAFLYRRDCAAYGRFRRHVTYCTPPDQLLIFFTIVDELESSAETCKFGEE